MKSLNKITLIGNLGDNIQIHNFDNGGKIGTAPLATSFEYTNKTSGEKVQETEWHTLKFRDKGAEIIEKYTKKGSKLYIEGRVKTRKWQDKDGNDRYSSEVIVNDFMFLDGKNEGSGNAIQAPQQPQGIPDNKDEDDLPF